MSATGKLSRWVFPVMLASAVTVGACAPKTSPSAKRPATTARLEIVAPTPNETTGPNLTLTLNLIGATIVPATVTGGPLRVKSPPRWTKLSRGCLRSASTIVVVTFGSDALSLRYSAAFGFHATLTGTLGATLIGHQVVQVSEFRAELSTAIEMYQAMEMTFWLPETEAALAQVQR